MYNCHVCKEILGFGSKVIVITKKASEIVFVYTRCAIDVICININIYINVYIIH